ncbi:MAG: hypothetical protein NZL96_00515 [Patescibacteria group bacterium]|nr:hypothetical protein [Patescibacteria group bacterium]
MTSNGSKLAALFHSLKTLGVRTPVDNLNPLFDESSIQNRVLEKLGGLNSGYFHPVFVSCEKLLEQRSKEAQDQIDPYSVIITSDSVIIVGEPGNGLVVNKDSPKEIFQEAKREAELNKRPVYFVGVSSFGRLIDGYPVYQAITYFNFKIDGQNLTFPININNLADTPHEFGFIDSSGKLIKKGENDFLNGRAFISGLTPEVISFALEYLNLFQLEELLSAQISKYPFNTAIFYDLRNKGLSYEEIVSDWRDIFQKHGGNCSFHSLFFFEEAKKRGYSPKILTLESKMPNSDEGHSAVLLGRFIFDPGLTIPYPIPCSSLIRSSIELGKNNSDGKIAYYAEKMVSDKSRGGIQIQKRGGGIFLPIVGEYSFENFLKKLPRILEDLHGKRESAKIDYHDARGIRTRRQEFKVNKKD